MTSRGLLWRPFAFIAPILLATGTLAVLAPPAVAAGPSCFVRNVATTHLYRGGGPNLQRAIDGAKAGTKLTVRGVCRGTYTVGRSLTLIGRPMAGYPTPTLDGKAVGRVLTVSAGSVVLNNLVITNGAVTQNGEGSPTPAPSR